MLVVTTITETAMPRPPFPAGVQDRPFPISSGWRGSSWHEILSHHLDLHARPGADTFIGFDDADRLCLTLWAERGYATRVPLTMVPWLLDEMAKDGITARPNHPLQFRQERGPDGSRLRDAPVDIAAVRAHLAEATGLPVTCFASEPGEDLVNLSLDEGGPVILRETALGRHIAGWIERHGDKWIVANAVIDPGEVRPVTVNWARGDIRQTRPGTAIESMLRRMDQRVALDAELAAHKARIRDEDNAPGF